MKDFSGSHHRRLERFISEMRMKRTVGFMIYFVMVCLISALYCPRCWNSVVVILLIVLGIVRMLNHYSRDAWDSYYKFEVSNSA